MGSMSKMIRDKKKKMMADGGMIDPEDTQGEQMTDPIDELNDHLKETNDQIDDAANGMNSEEVKFPENDALDMDMKKKKDRIAKIMSRSK